MGEKTPLLKKFSPLIFAFFVFLWCVSGIGDPLWGADAEGISSFFPKIGGWKQQGEIQIFSRQNLYEYINGAADLYLNYDFREVRVAEYRNGEKASVIVEIYLFQTSNHAFGIYSQERLPSGSYLKIGAQGYIEKEILNFLSGTHYVKINSYKTGGQDREVLLAFAKGIAENMGGEKSLPAPLSYFPEEGKKDHSEKFIAKNFLGYSFFHSGFTADYDPSGKKFKLFVMEGTNRMDCRDMLQKHLQSTGNLQANLAEGRYTIKDLYHGEVELSWEGKYIWGVLNLGEPILRSKYLRLLEERLPKIKQ